jgi:hypothetical protein
MEGRARIRGIIELRVPQWTNGPRSYQLESWAQTLDKISLVLIASTGSHLACAHVFGPPFDFSDALNLSATQFLA